MVATLSTVVVAVEVAIVVVVGTLVKNPNRTSSAFELLTLVAASVVAGTTRLTTAVGGEAIADSATVTGRSLSAWGDNIANCIPAPSVINAYSADNAGTTIDCRAAMYEYAGKVNVRTPSTTE